MRDKKKRIHNVAKRRMQNDVEKTIDELTLFDDELMAKVFDENIEAARYLLQTVLGKESVEITRVRGQDVLKNPIIGGRDITLDISIFEIEGKQYDVEVQRDPGGSHPKRARFHSSMMDSRMLKHKQVFKELKDSYVIFFCRHDKFRKGEPVYHIERRVFETGKSFNDGSHIIYVNGKYKGDDMLGRLIHDFRCKKSSEMYNEILAKGVHHYKETEEGRKEMSEPMERLRRKWAKEAEEKGEKKGEKRTKVQAVLSLMDTMKFTTEQALDALKISGKERDQISKIVIKNTM